MRPTPKDHSVVSEWGASQCGMAGVTTIYAGDTYWAPDWTLVILRHFPNSAVELMKQVKSGTFMNCRNLPNADELRRMISMNEPLAARLVEAMLIGER